MPVQKSIALKSMKPTFWQLLLGSVMFLMLPVLFFANFQALKEVLVEEADHHLGLYEHSLENELERSQNLAFFLSRDAAVIDGLLSPRDIGSASEKLAAISEKVPGSLTFVFDTKSNFVAGSGGFVQVSESRYIAAKASQYFDMLWDGDGYTFYNTDPVTGAPCYVSLAPVQDEEGLTLGFVVAVLPLTHLETFWKSAGDQIFATNSEGKIVLSAHESWRGKSLSPSGLTDDEITFESMSDNNVTFFGVNSFFVSNDVSGIEWTLYYVLPKKPIYREALGNLFYAAIAIIMIICALYVFNMNVARSRLRHEQANLATLRALNDELETQIRDRIAAEQELLTTQRKLDRTNKMAVFGKLASSVTHELGQPVAAMRSYLTAEEIGNGATPTTLKLQRLATRMQHILEELRAFTRPKSVRFGPINIRNAIQASLDLLRPNIENANVRVVWADNGPAVFMHGNQLRIEQVFVNVIRNAIDAMQSSEKRILEIDLQLVDQRIIANFADTGPGFGDTSLETLTEPFYTTHASGNGMGLGLAVTADIVEEHDGYMIAVNRENGGGIMAFSFPLLKGEVQDVAAE